MLQLSDANLAANYTSVKEHEVSVEEPGQTYTITETNGNYYCDARNAIGCHSTFLLIHVKGHCAHTPYCSYTCNIWPPFPASFSSLAAAAVRVFFLFQ